MPKRRLLWRLFPSFAAIAAVALLIVGWLALAQYESSSLAEVRADLRGDATFLDEQLGAASPADRPQFAALCHRFDQARGVRVTLLLPDGKVELDSRNRPEELADQLNRPEIQQAIEGRAHDEIRYNRALDQRVIYLAAPIVRNGRLLGVLYLSRSLAAVDSAIEWLQARLLFTGLAIVGLAALLAWHAARSVVQPLDDVGRAADRVAGGEWSARAPVPDPRELAELAERFNRMAEQLQRRVGVLIQNNNEQKAVLASMAEGVLAVDSQERVISVNTASCRLLGLDPAQAQGRPLGEVVRNADLIRFINRALASDQPIEADVLLLGDRQRVMQAHGSALHDSEGQPIGVVVVLNDVTDFRRLEHIRRDFVANVSHELKTPITSIKGFVETLLDGAMRDPVDSDRFLRIIAKQADRLHAIIEDLLSLSKIEEREDAEDIVLEPVLVRGVLENAVYTCQAAARDHDITVTLECDESLHAKANSLLLEQAVVNLLDNAVKYSEPGHEVRVSADSADGEIRIHVADRGCGIAEEHVLRIFERFYRVDRARSRKLGGTGLGLAIVKHIVLAHRGRITVESTLGIGSTFTIHLLAK